MGDARPYGISCQQTSFTHSLIYHPLIHSHSLTCSYSLTRSHLLMHLLTHSLIHSFILIHSLSHSLIHSPLSPLIHSLSCTHSYSLISFTHSHSLSFIHSLTHSTDISNADCAQLCSGCWDMTVHENQLLNHLETWETNIRAGHD